MKLYRIYVVLILIFIIFTGTRLMAESPSYTTAGVFNGRMWQLLSSTQKISHLTGIQEGLTLCLNQIKEDLQIPADLMKDMKEAGIFDRRRLLFSSQGISAIETRLNDFYLDDTNLEIPIIEAYRHITLELNFASPLELKNNLSNLRRKFKE